MSTETESGLPSQASNAEQGANNQVEQQTRTEATAGQQQQEQQGQQGQQGQQEQQAEQQEPKRTPWFQTRIDELTRARHQAQREAETLRQQLAIYQQPGYQPEQAPQEQQRTQSPVDIDSLATQRAQQLLAEQRFAEQCNKVYSDGKAAFPDFDQAVANLQMLGVNRDFLELATSSDAGAKLLHHLGTDLDETARLLTLPPVQMARELTRLEIKLAQPAPPPPVSKAPAPITPLGSSALNDVGDPSRMSDAEWYAQRQKTRK